jgi:hypothetical protein
MKEGNSAKYICTVALNLLQENGRIVSSFLGAGSSSAAS